MTYFNSRFFFSVVAIQVLVALLVISNLSIMRQIIVPLYLIFVPGFALLKALRIETPNTTETLLFSIGLSVAFIMFVGFLLSSISFLSQPLSTYSLLVVTCIFVLLFAFIGSLREIKNVFITSICDSKISHLIPYFFLPLSAVIALLFVRLFENNLLVIILIISIAVIVSLISLSKVPASNYPIVILSISSTLLLTTFLTSNYINGYDVHYEYIVFTATKNNSIWNPLFGAATGPSWSPFYVSNSMLSSTVLPTALSNLANIDGNLIFNILFPMIFSLVPLALFQLYKTQIGSKTAFLSVIFFIFNVAFFSFRSNTRQMIAELFFVMLFLLILNNNANSRKNKILFIIFSFGLVVSYYTLTYVFLFLILIVWISVKIFNKNKNLGGVSSTSIMFPPVCTFLWYLYVSNGPFNRLNLFLRSNINNFVQEFFSPQSRGSEVITAVNIAAPRSFSHQLGVLFFYLAMLFILIGFITTILKRNNYNFDFKYRTLIFLSFLILSFSVIIPNFASDFQVEKLYHIALLFLSPLFVIGGTNLLQNGYRLLSVIKRKSHSFKRQIKEIYSTLLILLVLIPFFFFQTGFVYEITNDSGPTSFVLSGYKMGDLDRLKYDVINEKDLYGAIWILNYAVLENRTVYSDTYAAGNVLMNTLMSSNFATYNTIIVLENDTIVTVPSYIFLDVYNSKSGLFLYAISPTDITYRISDLPVFNNSVAQNAKIYTNGGSQIYFPALTY